jgi:hypothetical protein
MLIKAYGLFWDASEIYWPGEFAGERFRLLGRRGKAASHVQLADFKRQSGLYILYGNYGPHYVGLTRSNRMGARLKAHRRDWHKGKWERFSWFGFRDVLTSRNQYGLSRLRDLSVKNRGTTHSNIGELEALLIRALGLEGNYAKMKFPGAEPWTQVKAHEVDEYFAKVQW